MIGWMDGGTLKWMDEWTNTVDVEISVGINFRGLYDFKIFAGLKFF